MVVASWRKTGNIHNCLNDCNLPHHREQSRNMRYAVWHVLTTLPTLFRDNPAEAAYFFPAVCCKFSM